MRANVDEFTDFSMWLTNRALLGEVPAPVWSSAILRKQPLQRSVGYLGCLIYRIFWAFSVRGCTWPKKHPLVACIHCYAQVLAATTLAVAKARMRRRDTDVKAKKGVDSAATYSLQKWQVKIQPLLLLLCAGRCAGRRQALSRQHPLAG